MELFKVKSTKIRACDPCYDYSTSCENIIDNCMPGSWVGEQNTTRKNANSYPVDDFTVTNEKFLGKVKATEMLDFEVMVDSGQVGFFDNDMYPKGSTGESEDTSTMYGKICDATGFDDIANVGFGVAANTSDGDGTFKCYVGRHKDQVVIIKVVFEDEDEEDDDYEDEDDDYEDDYDR